MNVCGIVAEYNPFHNGHAYHIAQTRAALGEETAVVCAMSGNFVQRGGPAVFPKHARAEAAVHCGADLVLELPLPWALSSAEGFARGAVSIFMSTGIVTHLSFGSESGGLAALERTAALLSRPELDPLIRAELERGVPYARARQTAAEALAGDKLNVMSTPNDILALEYLKALRALDAPIAPLAVPRHGALHDAPEGAPPSPAPAETPPARAYLSASALRERLYAGGDISDGAPPAALAVYARETAAGRGPVSPAALDAALLSRLRALPRESYVNLPDVSEGLDARLYRAAREAASVAEAVARSKTKRYPAARIRRALLHAALGVTREDVAGIPPYLRVLAFNHRGRELLAQMRETAALPILTKPAAVRQLDARAQRIFELEAAATDLYVLGFPSPAERCGGAEWRASPIIIVE